MCRPGWSAKPDEARGARDAFTATTLGIRVHARNTPASDLRGAPFVDASPPRGGRTSASVADTVDWCPERSQ